MSTSREHENRLPREKLRAARNARYWSQGRAAAEIGVDRKTYQRWESGETDPHPYGIEQACRAFEMTAWELDFADHMPSSSREGEDENCWKPLWNVPYRRNPFFTGREHILRELQKKFFSSDTQLSACIQALYGLGGVGKTQIAVEYAYRYRDLYPWVLWVSGAKNTILSDYAAIAQLLDLPEGSLLDQSFVVAAVKRWLSTHNGWLLILDNVDAVEVVDEYLPPEFQGHVLLTTRLHALGPIIHSEVEVMDEKEGAALLLRRAKVLPIETPLHQAPSDEIVQAGALVEALGGLPLALDQAGAYIEETGCSLSGYLHSYRFHQSHLLGRRGTLVTHHPESVMTTFSLSFEQVQQTNPLAAELLCFCAFLAPDAIPEELILSDTSDDQHLLDEAIAVLRRFSLMRRNHNHRTLILHRLVQAVLKERLPDEEQQHWTERVMRAVNRAVPNFDLLTDGSYRRYLSHAHVCAELSIQWNVESVEAARLLHQTGLCLKACARYADAELFLQRSLVLRERLLGVDDVDTAITLNSLALLYHDQGKYLQAEAFYRRALAVHEREPEAEGLNIATVLDNLALLYDDQGKYKDAEPLCQRALDIHIQILGPKHPRVATNLNNLAGTYRRLGKYDQAEMLLWQALTVYEETVGPDHLLLATNLDNLAGIYRRQGNYSQAESFFQRALFIREQELGVWHPDVATCLSNLGVFYDSCGQSKQARQFHERALTIFEQILSPQHPYVAICLSNLAIHYGAQKGYSQAEKLIRHALEIDEKALGSAHPAIASDANILAVLLCEQEKYDQAEVLHKRALALFEQRLGREHTHVAHSLNNLAVAYSLSGKLSQARSLYQRAFTIYWQTWQSSHPEVLTCLHNIAKFFSATSLDIQRISSDQEISQIAMALGIKTTTRTKKRLPLCRFCGKELSAQKAIFCHVCGHAVSHSPLPSSLLRDCQQAVHQPPSRPVRCPLQQRLP